MSNQTMPQGGVYATLDREFRVWVESWNSIKQSAVIRMPACTNGARPVRTTVPLSRLDFTKPKN